MTKATTYPHRASILLLASALSALSPAISFAQLAEPATTPEPAEAQSQVTSLSAVLSGEAKEHYENARMLFSSDDFAGAELKFQAAFKASSNARLLWDIAACEKGQRHYAKASQYIEQFLRDGETAIDEERRTRATEWLEKLRPLVGSIDLKANEANVTVYVDDEKVDVTPASQLRVDMGSRRIRVTKSGFEDWSTVENVLGGTTVLITVELKKIRHVGILRVQADGAYDVMIDGARVGVGNWTGELRSGTHILDVRGKGMLPYQGDVVVTDKQTNLVRVSLRPEATTVSQSSNTWLWITGGTLLAAGMATGAYFLVRPGDTAHATTIAGTMQPGSINLP